MPDQPHRIHNAFMVHIVTIQSGLAVMARCGLAWRVLARRARPVSFAGHSVFTVGTMNERTSSDRKPETRSQPGYEEASADSLNVAVQAHHPRPLPRDWAERIPRYPPGHRGETDR